MQTDNKLNVLICGSERFDDKNFVFGMLDALANNLPSPIDNIITSKFSGCCQFAREWISENNDKKPTKVGILEYSFDNLLEEKNLSIYEQSNIPDFILKEDPFFQKGVEKLLSTNVKLVLSFPNKEGILGAATRNIQRFAALGNVQYLDCSTAFGMITTYRQEADNNLYVPQETIVNRHPGKKL